MSATSREATKPWRYTVETLRVPHFGALWTSNLLYFTAWSAQSVVLQWLVTSLTDSRTLIGAVGFVQGAVVILSSPFAGVAVDRLRRRNLLMFGRLCLAAVLGVIASLVWLGVIAIWQLFVAIGIAALISSLMNPATQTYVLDVVPVERAQSAVSLNAAGSVTGQTVGPMAGALLVAALGFAGAYGVIALGVVAAALLLGVNPIRGESDHATPNVNVLRELREAIRYVMQHRPLAMALLACSLSIFNGALMVMRPVFARHVLEVGSEGYGALAASFGMGGMIAALGLAARPPLRRPGLVIAWSMLGFSALIVLYSFAFSYKYVLVVELLSGFVGQLWMVSTFTGVQMAVPENMRGRVMGLVFMIVNTALLGALGIGILADHVGDQLAMGIFGAVPFAALCGIIAYGYRDLREL
jgi:MFS family permease